MSKERAEKSGRDRAEAQQRNTQIAKMRTEAHKLLTLFKRIELTE